MNWQRDVSILRKRNNYSWNKNPYWRDWSIAENQSESYSEDYNMLENEYLCVNIFCLLLLLILLYIFENIFAMPFIAIKLFLASKVGILKNKGSFIKYPFA